MIHLFQTESSNVKGITILSIIELKLKQFHHVLFSHNWYEIVLSLGNSRLIYRMSEEQCEVASSPEFRCHQWDAEQQEKYLYPYRRSCPCTLFHAYLDVYTYAVPGQWNCFIYLYDSTPQVTCNLYNVPLELQGAKLPLDKVAVQHLLSAKGRDIVQVH